MAHRTQTKKGDKPKGNSQSKTPDHTPFEAVFVNLDTTSLALLVRDWIQYGRAIKEWSMATTDSRHTCIEKLLWFLKERYKGSGGDKVYADEDSVQAFFVYLQSEDPRGKWGVKKANGWPRYTQAASEGTVEGYRSILNAFFSWCVAEEMIATSPMGRVATRKSSEKQIEFLSQAQVNKLLKIASQSAQPARDVAIVSLLIDTGLLANELCWIRMDEIDIPRRTISVSSHKSKVRQIIFGKFTAQALMKHLRDRQKWIERNPFLGNEAFLFLAQRGQRAGEPLTVSGLDNLLGALGARARLRGVRCTPTVLRDTFVITFLKGGGSVDDLQRVLGLTSIAPLKKYSQLVERDDTRKVFCTSLVDTLFAGNQ